MLSLRNTLTRKAEEVVPLEPGLVRMYTCGPTVYRDAHIGNLRSYLMADWIRRALEHQGLQTLHVKNITDVGHMRQEQLEQGEDKVIAAALAAGKTPQEIAQFYTEAFHRDEARLGILPAHHSPKATDHIPDMVAVIQRLVERGYAYEAQGNVYYAVSRFPTYGELSGNTGGDLLKGVRVEVDPLKQAPRDFTLWKAAEPGRTLAWPSPWGEGFPGWHIECSAMGYRYLGAQMDIHTGGVDNIFPHHEGEIAQSEGAFGQPHVRYWVHGQHLLADGVKMSKSAANDYTLDDLEQRGFEPLAFRYLCLTARYRTRLNFTFSSLRAAQRGLLSMKNWVWQWSLTTPTHGDYGASEEQWREAFWRRVNDDLDLPGALAVTWAVVHCDLPSQVKHRLVLEFDQGLGLGLEGVPLEYEVSPQVEAAVRERWELRQQSQYGSADEMRAGLSTQGYVLEDARAHTLARPKSNYERVQERWQTVSSSRELPSLADVPDQVDFSVVVTACNYRDDVVRCLNSVLRNAAHHAVEVVAMDNGSTDGAEEWLEAKAREDQRVRVIHTDHTVGEAAAKNMGLKQARGRYVVMLDTSAEVTGDLFSALEEYLQQPSIGVAGPWGVVSGDLRHFDEQTQGPVDAMQAYCFAFPRRLLKEVGWMHESFRFYRNLDLEYSFRFKHHGYRIVADERLPVVRHEHRVWTNLPEGEREALSQKNFRRFLREWGHHTELLEHPGEHHGDEAHHDGEEHHD